MLVTDPAGEQMLGNGMQRWGILLPVGPRGWVVDKLHECSRNALSLAEREVIAELVWREFNRFFRPCTDEDAAEWRGVQWHEPDVRVVADVVVELETRGTDEANWVHFHFYGDRVVHVRYTGLVHFNVQPAQLMAAAAARQAHAALSPDESTDEASDETSDDEE